MIVLEEWKPRTAMFKHRLVVANDGDILMQSQAQRNGREWITCPFPDHHLGYFGSKKTPRRPAGASPRRKRSRP